MITFNILLMLCLCYVSVTIDTYKSDPSFQCIISEWCTCSFLTQVLFFFSYLTFLLIMWYMFLLMCGRCYSGGSIFYLVEKLDEDHLVYLAALIFKTEKLTTKNTRWVDGLVYILEDVNLVHVWNVNVKIKKSNI